MGTVKKDKNLNKFDLATAAKEPIVPVKSKWFITKVILLAAMARPRYDYHSKKHFDGKIGIWPFVHEVKAQRNSCNRQAGTMETKCFNINGDMFTEYLTTKVIPGFSNTIQSLQAQKCASNIDDLIDAVVEAFNEIIPTKLSDNFIPLRSVMREILSHEGSNDFKIPHLDKSGNGKRGTSFPFRYRLTRHYLRFGNSIPPHQFRFIQCREQVFPFRHGRAHPSSYSLPT